MSVHSPEDVSGVLGLTSFDFGKLPDFVKGLMRFKPSTHYLKDSCFTLSLVDRWVGLISAVGSRESIPGGLGSAVLDQLAEL